MTIVISVAADTFVLTIDEVTTLTKNREDIYCRVSPTDSTIVEIWETSPQETTRNIIFSSVYSNFATPSGASASAVCTGINTILRTNQTIAASLADGTYGDVTVSSSGTVFTVVSSSETVAGKIEIATQAETNTGTDDVRSVTPLKLKVAGDLRYQPLDSDLTTIAALAPSNDDIIQRKAGAWTNRTIAQYYADLQASVKDDVYFTIAMNCDPAAAGLNPADATNYYFGQPFLAGVGTNSAIRKVYIPYNCTLIGGSVSFAQTNGSNETSTMYVRVNDTTDVSIFTGIDLSGVYNAYATGLSTNLAAGDHIQMKWTTPTWGTNPTVVRITVTLYLKRR